MPWPPSPRARRPLFAALGAALALSAGACGEEQPTWPTRDPGPSFARVTRDQFGDDADPTAVVATVDDAPVTVGELAICLQSEPIRGVEGCLDDLVATALAERYATPADAAAPSVADARLAAQASAYLRDRIEDVIRPETLPDDDIAAFREMPGNRLYVEGPELRQCSHLLVRDGEGHASQATHDLAERIRRSLDAVAGSAHEADLNAARHQFANEARDAGLSLRVESHLLVRQDSSQPDPWPSLPLMVQPFADAAFGLGAPGELSEPVDTDFGTHVILLERVYPGSALPPEAADRLLRHELAQRRRFEAFSAIVRQLSAQAEIVRYNAVEIFRLDDEAIIRERNASIRQSLGAQGP